MDGSGDLGSTSEHAAGLAGVLLDDESLHDLLQRLTLLTRDTLSASQAVSITVVQDSRYRTTNSTGSDALDLDEAQYEDDCGPCLEAIRSTRQLEATAERKHGRWPRFDEEAARAGVSSVLSTPLVPSPGHVVGALNVYSAEDGGFDAADRSTAERIGELAAMLVVRALALENSNRLNEQLRDALATREVIGVAKGILMESQTCTRNEAFDLLRRASQRQNRKLREVAEELVVRVEARAGTNSRQT